MVIQTDALGNKCMGDVNYANHSIFFPSVNYPIAHPLSDFSAEMTALLTASGASFRNVAPQTDIDNLVNQLSFFAFASASDTIDDRFSFEQDSWLTDGNGGYMVSMYNNNGYGSTNNTGGIVTDRISACNNRDNDTIPESRGLDFDFTNTTPAGNNTEVYVAGVADAESIGFAMWQYSKTGLRINLHFWYAGTLDNVNTGFSYYNADTVSQSVMIACHNEMNPVPEQGYCVRHYIASTDKRALQTGDALYAIACSSGGPPSGNWGTDPYIFDDDVSTGYPAMGTLRNIIFADGTYEIGKPVQLATAPDAGFNSWLPVGRQPSGKTLLMRCYTSTF